MRPVYLREFLPTEAELAQPLLYCADDGSGTIRYHRLTQRTEWLEALASSDIDASAEQHATEPNCGEQISGEQISADHSRAENSAANEIMPQATEPDSLGAPQPLDRPLS